MAGRLFDDIRQFVGLGPLESIADGTGCEIRNLAWAHEFADPWADSTTKVSQTFDGRTFLFRATRGKGRTGSSSVECQPTGADGWHLASFPIRTSKRYELSAASAMKSEPGTLMAGGGNRARVRPSSVAVTHLDTGNGTVSIQCDGGWNLDRGGVEAWVGWVVGSARAGWVKDEGSGIGRWTCWGTGMERGRQRDCSRGLVLPA